MPGRSRSRLLGTVLKSIAPLDMTCPSTLLCSVSKVTSNPNRTRPRHQRPDDLAGRSQGSGCTRTLKLAHAVENTLPSWALKFGQKVVILAHLFLAICFGRQSLRKFVL